MQNFPTNPRNNQLASCEGYTYKWNGKQWIILNPPDPTTVPVYISKTPPSPPLTKGSIWFNTSNSICSVWVPQPKGLTWSQIAPESEGGLSVVASGAAPKNPKNGALWYNPTSKVLSVWAAWATPESWIPLINSPGTSPGASPDPAVATVSETAPVYPIEGQLWYQPSKGTLSSWLPNSGNLAWETLVSPQTNAAPVLISSTSPKDVKVGDLWFDPTFESFNLRVNYGGVEQWVNLAMNSSDISANSLSKLLDVDAEGKIDRSLLYYDASVLKFKVDSSVTTTELTDGGNF